MFSSGALGDALFTGSEMLTAYGGWKRDLCPRKGGDVLSQLGGGLVFYTGGKGLVLPSSTRERCSLPQIGVLLTPKSGQLF